MTAEGGRASGLAIGSGEHTGRGPAHWGEAILLHVTVAAAATTCPGGGGNVATRQPPPVIAGYRIAAAVLHLAALVVDAADVVADGLQQLQSRANLRHSEGQDYAL
ncbi:hypothetical protein E2C01_019224 [Portunus trituberculatus]|uniref:Uncharacterized protein n=1 Tax=Portunus trituberculatus TaxID=210409 RepID=A0A5B7DYV5_PORTR|nr:hypothetical protein [Portunus trituberculatus]